MSSTVDKCETCGKSHDFIEEEVMDCVPPKEVLYFGHYVIDKRYREALYKAFPFYTAEEVVGSYLGYNPYFPSEHKYFEELEEEQQLQEEEKLEEEEEEEEEEPEEDELEEEELEEEEEPKLHKAPIKKMDKNGKAKKDMAEKKLKKARRDPAKAPADQ